MTGFVLLAWLVGWPILIGLSIKRKRWRYLLGSLALAGLACIALGKESAQYRFAEDWANWNGTELFSSSIFGISLVGTIVSTVLLLKSKKGSQ